ncbi:MAG: GNAT family N-acetyltransferase [Betaproteobacteria bacterium]|nr:GNAT family N-acetyltransferase [Betaproteobacteria bacterium]
MSSRPELELIWPNLDRLPGYRAALAAGWSPDNIRGAQAAQEELERIASDPEAFIAAQVDREAKGAPITLPDGSTARRLPGYRRWLWDGEFCGVISLRWQAGTADLPPHCLGHIGYAVVPWKRQRGYATAALRMILRDARAEGLPHVIITTQPENLASQKVIVANGGQGLGRIPMPRGYADGEELVFRIDLSSGSGHG